MRSALLVFAVAFAVQASGQDCYATPETAAQSAFGAMPHAALPAGAGFRAEGFEADVVLHRVWMRVRPCSNMSAATMLVPTTLSMQTVATTQAPAPKFADVLVHAGETLAVVFQSAAVHMRVEGVVQQFARAGDMVDVAIKRPGPDANEPGQRIRGTLRADKTVEVLR